MMGRKRPEEALKKAEKRAEILSANGADSGMVEIEVSEAVQEKFFGRLGQIESDLQIGNEFLADILMEEKDDEATRRLEAENLQFSSIELAQMKESIDIAFDEHQKLSREAKICPKFESPLPSVFVDGDGVVKPAGERRL